jgi:hypothetical protein
MTEPTPSTIAGNLLVELTALADSTPVNEFAIKRIERDAEKLKGVDASEHAMLLGSIASLRGNYDDTTRHYRRALQLASNPVGVTLNYAVSLQVLARFTEMRDLLMTLVQKNRGNVHALRQASKMFMDSGAFQSALDLAPLADKYNVDLGERPLFAGLFKKLMDERGLSEDDVLQFVEVTREAVRMHGIVRPIAQHRISYAISGEPSLVYEVLVDQPVEVCDAIEESMVSAWAAHPLSEKASGALVPMIGFATPAESRPHGAA